MEDKAKDTISQSIALVERHQANSTKLLRDRTHDVYRLKTTLERAIRAHMEEFSNLAEQRSRMMQALVVLQMPESIGITIYRLLTQTNCFSFVYKLI